MKLARNFKGKYDSLIAEATERFQMGGILSGDLVRFRKDTMKNDKIKNLTAQYKAMIEDAMNTDLNLRASSIKSSRPNTSGYYGGGQNSGTDAATDFYVDVVVEYAPGLFKTPMTVPIEVLEVVDTDGNLAPVPDSLKRKNNVHMPKEVKTEDANRKLPTVNAKSVTSVVDGRTQVGKPAEYKRLNLGKLTMEQDMKDHPFNKMRERKGKEGMDKIAKKLKKDVKDVSVDDIYKYNTPKKKKEITLEDVYNSMSTGGAPQTTAGAGTATPTTGATATPGASGSGRKVYKLTFGQPYGKNPDELVKKITSMPGFSNNITPKVIDDNNLELDTDSNVDEAEFEKMLTNVVKDGVTVAKPDAVAGQTTFNAQKAPGAVVGGASTGGMQKKPGAVVGGTSTTPNM